MGSKHGDVCFWRWALSICQVFGLQIISETRHTSMVTHFISTVLADNFCPIDQTIWQCFESKFAVQVLSPFPFTFAFQSTVFFLNANPASSSSVSLSYSSASLWFMAVDGICSLDPNNACFSFFFFLNRALIAR